ncbi:AAA family ATPase [Nocardioides aquaticus]|uniref:AAA family ATPase n=1 Tax=Nocardioides aquaticus TaxID=160826 RepID=UPI003B82F732
MGGGGATPAGPGAAPAARGQGLRRPGAGPPGRGSATCPVPPRGGAAAAPGGAAVGGRARRAAAGRCRGGRGGVLTLQGPAGIGTSRVAREALDRARTRGFVPVHVDVADHPRGRAAGVWRDLLGGLLGIRGGSARSVWIEALARALPDLPDHAAVLGPVLGLGAGATPRPLDPEAGQLAPELAQTAVGRVLVRRSRRRPVVVVVEHADRLDEVSVGLLHELGASAGRCAAALVVTWGSEEGPVPSAAPTDVVTLAPLDPDETGLLAEEAWRRAGGGTPPAWLAGIVVPHAGGNPLVAQASVHALLGRWRPGEPPPASVVLAGPVAGVVASQVDRLPVHAHELLTVLAVAGRPCGLRLLADLLPAARDVADVRLLATRLSADRLVTSADGPDETYRIGHDLVRRVVHDATSHAERERLHRALVDRLVAADADPVEVAEHVEPLADPVLGRRWYPLAARAARDGWDPTGALRWLERLRPLVHGPALDRVELEVLEVLLVAGRANEVLERFDLPVDDKGAAGAGAGAVAPGTGDRGPVGRRLLVLAEASYACGQLHRTEQVAAELMRLVDGTDEARYQRAGELLVLARCHQGDLEAALVAGRALTARAEDGADPAARASASAALAVALVLSGQPGAAAERYRAALVAATTARDVVRQVHVLSDLAGCEYLQGRHQECVELMTQARGSADTIGYRRHLPFSLNNEGQLRVALGDPYATACASASVQRSLELGDLSEAADALQTWLGATPSLAADAGLWRRLVEVDLRLGRWLEAAAEWAELAVVLARSGRYDAARHAAREADGADPGRNPADVRRRTTLARLLADARDPARSGAPNRQLVLDGLDRLVRGAAADERESAEVAVERWRLSRTPATRAEAVRSVQEAYATEPSAVVRSWFRLLREPAPPAPDRLPPPVGIPRGRHTRRDLEQAFADVEAAVAEAAAP